MSVDITAIGLVIVLVDLLERRHILRRGFIGNDMAVKINFLDAFEFQLVGDNTLDIAVVDDVFDLLRL